MLRMRFRFQAACAAVALFSMFDPSVAGQAVKWHPWFEIGGYGANNEHSRGETTLWAPLTQTDRTLLFTDIRGKFFEGDQQEGNIALGYREMSYGGWNFGAWAGYDIRRTENDNNFGQVAFGVEALSPIWDFRFNGYVPTKTDEVVS